MKHDFVITINLLLIFLIAQAVGLLVIAQYVDIAETVTTGKTVSVEQDIHQVIAPPEIDNETLGWLFIMVPVLIGTGLVLLIARFRLFALWKLWFMAAVVIAMSYAIHPFISGLLDESGAGTTISVTLAIAFVVGYLKIFRPNVIVHNLTEIFVYAGIAALVIPFLNIMAATILLVLISIYDAYAVWSSKHMVTMAKFQVEANLFAGLFIPKSGKMTKGVPVQSDTNKKHKESTHAVLGGGDIAFPLLFSGAVFKYTGDILTVTIVTIGAVCALATLLFFSKPGRFYPAMPFISSGCFIGYLITFLL